MLSFHDVQREADFQEDCLLGPPFSFEDNGTELFSDIIWTMIPSLADQVFIEYLFLLDSKAY